MPAPGWKKKTKSPSGVGLTLVNLRKSAHKAYKDSEDKAGKNVLESVLEVRDLDDVMEQAELAGRLFAVNNPVPELLINSEVNVENLTPAQKRGQRNIEESLHRASLRVPRRPKWTPEMTAEELDVEERKAFLSWRRGLARLEANDKLVITPFEKNLDIWRQLWRVLERSDLIVIVVDSRNPLFYRCPDLEVYVRELDPNKKVMLLLNKADLLTTSSRQKWAAYFRSQGTSFLFWSARMATDILEGKAGSSTKFLASDQQNEDLKHSDDIRVLGRDELLDRLQKEAENIVEHQRESSRVALSERVNGASQVREDLGSEEGCKVTQHTERSLSRAVVGFVGYPNVGKSSTINALVGGKKTGVTSTPGKTKHFQTLIINEQLMLCDCPGLVFPSFTSSKSDMVASGVLPIDKLTDHRGPVQVVADNVPRAALEALYGISLPKPKLYEDQARPPSAAELLFVYAVSRGYFSNSGFPDETRAARLILKDFLSGKIPYCQSPPGEPAINVAPDASRPPAHDDAGSSEEDNDLSEYAITDDEAVDKQRSPDIEASTSALKSMSLQGKEKALRAHTVDAGSTEQTAQLLGIVKAAGNNIAQVFDDLDSSVDTELKLKNANSGISSNAPHKMHKKAARKKDRTWRAGGKQSGSQPVISGVKIRVSHGAADRYQVQIF